MEAGQGKNPGQIAPSSKFCSWASEWKWKCGGLVGK